MPKDSTSTLKGLLANEKPLKVDPERLKELEMWLTTEVPAAVKRRNTKMRDIEKWRKTLSGINPAPINVSGTSHVSVPVTMWITSGLEARISRSLIKSNPMLDIRPVTRTEDAGDTLDLVARNLSTILEALIRNKRSFDGERAIKVATSNQVRYGLGAIKVILVPPAILRVQDGDATREIVRPGTDSIKWRVVPFDNLLYFDGYDTDVDSMPFIGHQISKPWSSIKQWADAGYYYKEAVEAVVEQYKQQSGTSELPKLLRPHCISELYLDFDIDGRGLSSIVVDWHEDAERVLRVGANQFDGYRPIRLAQFDLPSETGDACGQGMCEKLQSVQAEANMLHNIIVEAGKRAAAHLTVISAGSGADKALGDEMIISPGTVVSTENPDEDVKVHPLGDARAAADLLMLENANLGYAMNLSGMSQSSFGDVTAGKRVAAAVGGPAMREGRTVTENALNEMAGMINECVYLSLDAMRKSFPKTALLALLDAQQVADMQNIVFNIDSTTTRDMFIVTASSQDVAAASEERKTELFALNQFLMAFYEKAFMLLQPALQSSSPEGAQKLLLKVYDKLANGVDKVLMAIDNVKDPSELLITADDITEILGLDQPAQMGMDAGMEEPDVDTAF